MIPVTLEVDRERRRVVVKLPLAVSEMTTDGWLFRLIFEICGDDAVADALVGSHYSAMALCARGESQAWRDELGLELPESDYDGE